MPRSSQVLPLRGGHRGPYHGARFLRDTDEREVDFVVLRDRKPLSAVECKTGEKAIGNAVRYYAERTPIPRFFKFISAIGHTETGRVTVLPFHRFCEDLDLP